VNYFLTFVKLENFPILDINYFFNMYIINTDTYIYIYIYIYMIEYKDEHTTIGYSICEFLYQDIRLIYTKLNFVSIDYPLVLKLHQIAIRNDTYLFFKCFQMIEF